MVRVYAEMSMQTRILSQIPFIIMSRTVTERLCGGYSNTGPRLTLSNLLISTSWWSTAERFLSDHFSRILRERERLQSERQFLIGSITSLILALEARDQYTPRPFGIGGRIRGGYRPGDVLGRGAIERVRIAGKLHDLGKIGIRDDILLKPGPLNEEEWEVLKLHPLIGAEILAPIQSLADIIPAIASHHERIDGKGYPGA